VVPRAGLEPAAYGDISRKPPSFFVRNRDEAGFQDSRAAGGDHDQGWQLPIL